MYVSFEAPLAKPPHNQCKGLLIDGAYVNSIDGNTIVL